MGHDIMISPLSILACPVGWLENVGDVIGGLERTNGEAASEAGVGQGGEFLASETSLRGLGRDGEFVY
jgi:hypothetical protein